MQHFRTGARLAALALGLAILGSNGTGLAAPVTSGNSIGCNFGCVDEWFVSCGSSQFVCATVEGDAENSPGGFFVDAEGIVPSEVSSDYEAFGSTDGKSVCLMRTAGTGVINARVQVSGFTSPPNGALEYQITASCYRFGFPKLKQMPTRMRLRRDF